MAEFKLGRLKFVWRGEWTTAATYVKDDVVRHGGKSYITIQAHVAAADFYTDIAHWSLMTDGTAWVGNWEPSGITYAENDLVLVNGRTYICTTHNTSGANFTADAANWELYSDGFKWSGAFNATSTRYELNDIVSFGGCTYICINAHTTSGAFNEAKWQTFAEGFQFDDSWDDTTEYQIGDIVGIGGYVYKAITRNTNSIPTQNVADWHPFVLGLNVLAEWDDATAYRIGDVVNYGGNQYFAIADTEGFQSPEDPYKWKLYSNGLDWRGAWSNASVRYKKHQVVNQGTSSYVCIAHHTSSNGNSPAADTVHSYWQTLADGSASAVVTTRGDTIFRDSSGVARKPIGAANDLYVVNQAGTEPEWSTTADVTVNSITIATGDIGPLTEGNIKTTLGDIGTEAGDIYTTLGNINAAGGDVTAAFNITANTGNISVTSAGDIGTANGDLYTNNGSVLITGDIITTGANDGGGKLTVTHNITTDSAGTNDASLYVGIGAELSTTEGPTFTDASAVLRRDAPAFVQIALQNTNSASSASTDMIVYADNGDNDSGWMDMGITSSTYSDANYGITGHNDGYIFMSAPAGTTGNGNLYISTNDTGLQNDIIFSTNGFGAVTSEKMRLIGHTHDGLEPGLVINVTVTTLLTSNINSSTDIILVVDATAFPTVGTIEIGTEQITYTGTSATEFTGCTRGANDTIAASHSINAEINGASASVSPTTGALRVTGGVGLTGSLNAEGDIIAFGGAIYQGKDGGVTAKQLTIDDQLFPGYIGLTNASGIFTGDADGFVQFALKNHSSGTGASTDIIAYSSNGDNNSGWIDMGITSENYADPAFTVTGPNTGYLFMSAPNSGIVTHTSGTHTSSVTTINVDSTADFPNTGTCTVAGGGQFSYTGKTSTSFTGCTRGVNASSDLAIAADTHVYLLSNAAYTGDLLVGTGTGGSHNDIVLFSGGFDAGNERIRVIGNTRVGHAAGVEILASTASTSTTTGALRVNGGMGLIGNLNVGGDVGIAGNIAIVGTITVGGSGSSLSTTSLTVSDPMIGLGKGNVGDLIDLGLFGQTSSADTTLNGAINASVTSIVLTTAAAFAASGTIIIDDEEITYSGKSADTLTGCTRGVNSTIAATHLTAAIVIQAKYTGLIRDASDGIFKLFKTLGGNKPTSTVNISDATFAYAPLTLGSLIVDDTTASTVYTEGSLIAKGGVGIAGALYSNGLANFVGAISSGGLLTGVGLTSTGTVAVNASGGITTNQSSFPIANSSATTIDFGGAATTLNLANVATGAQTVNLGTASTGDSTYNLGTGITSTGNTKAINIGTNGAAGSTTNVSIGSSNGGTTTINSSSLVGVATTQNLFNSAATTLNIGGAATTVSIGASTGTTTINNQLNFSGTLSLGPVIETTSTLTGATGVVAHNYNTSNVWYHTGIAANFTANITNTPTTINKVSTITIVLVQGAAAYIPNALQIDGVAQTIKWAGNTTPTPVINRTELVVFTLIRTGAGAWVVLGQHSSYA